MEIIHNSQECLCSFCNNAGSCARLTQIYTNVLLYICELDLSTDRAVGSTIPQYRLTPCSSQFPQVWQMMCCVLDNTWTPYFQSATFSLLQRYMDRGHLHVISNLHHHRLTSLQTYVIVKSQHTLTTTIQSSARQCKLLDSQNADVLADSVSCWYCVGFCLV